MIKIKIGKMTNEIPISENLSKTSGEKLAPIAQPNSARQTGRGETGISIFKFAAVEIPITNNGPSIHGKGMPIKVATPPPRKAINKP